ncbi:MAG: AAA family ATPase [Elusimicrobiaceae bacterium]|nr:AAA family ATPase [Elusimicrobiaceae bacterium]
MIPIKTIHLFKFRQFRDVSIEFKQINVLVGANNSGKTSILTALRIFFRILNEEGSLVAKNKKIEFHQHFVNMKSIVSVANERELWTNAKVSNQKAGRMKIGVTFANDLQITLIFSYMFGQIHVSGEIMNPKSLSLEKINQLIYGTMTYIPGLVGILAQEPYVTQARMLAMTVESRYSEIYRSALFHLSKYKNSKKIFMELNDLLKKHFNIELELPTNFKPESNIFVDIKYKQNGVYLDISNAGFGMLQVIQLLTYLYLNKPQYLLIDEPDSHLHPHMQGILGGILQDIAHDLNAQIFIASHSPDFIDVFDAAYVLLVDPREKYRFLDEKEDIIDTLHKVGVHSISAISRLLLAPHCFFVEDKYIDIYKSMDRLCGWNIFGHKSNYRSIEGVDKFDMFDKLYYLLEDVLGRKLKVFFIRDRDGLLPQYYSKLKEHYLKNGHKNILILDKHEIENYILDPKIIVRAAPKGVLKLSYVKKTLLDVAHQLKPNTLNILGRHNIRCAHYCKNDQEKINDMAIQTEVNAFFNDTLTVEQVLTYFPGKELLKSLLERINNEKTLKLTQKDLINVLKKSDVPKDLHNFIIKNQSK